MAEYLRGYDHSGTDLLRLLYSISNVNITKLEQIAAAMQKKLGMEQAVSLDEVPEDIKYPTIGEETGGVPDSTSTESIQKMAEELREYFANSNIDAQTSSSDDVIYIRFKNDLLFGPDSAQLREESVSMLDSLGEYADGKKEDENPCGLYKRPYRTGSGLSRQ